MKRRISKIKVTLLFPIVLIGTVILSTPAAHAIPVEDIPASIWRTVKDLVGKTGAQIFNNALTTTINQLAYDYATYLGSGAPGQKPFFQTKSLGDRLSDAGDAAFGTFIENIGSNGLGQDDNGNFVQDDSTGSFMGIKSNVNLCSPDLFTLNKITLGLITYNVPGYKTNACSFRTLKKSWEDEASQITSIINDKAYLQKVGQYFSPGGNDLSISLELFGEAQDKINIAKNKVQSDSDENKGWLRVESLVGKEYEDPPGSVERQAQQTQDLYTGAIGKYSGDVFVDAANIFLNQLALSAFNRLMKNIGSRSDSVQYGSAQDRFAQGSGGGTLNVENKLKTIVEARFGDRTDYNILGELITCQTKSSSSRDNTALPGPTNCVITDSFSTAISKRMTVINAMNDGYLKKDYAFGFKGLNNEEPPYNQGYPYRSLLILRKYRIIPVGWELAAQFIQKNNQNPSPTVNTQDIKLIDLVRCFDPCDEYTGYNDGTGGSISGNGNGDSGGSGTGACRPVQNNPEAWCTGLVDPNWVLEVPKMYCKAQGYGPEIQNSTYVTKGKFCSNKPDKACVADCPTPLGNTDPLTCCQTNTEGSCETKSDLTVTRNQNYCADEQSCIKENDDGSCAYYGYCTAEKRQWVFSDNTKNQCQPVNNTCQTFSGNGKTVSYLENTLDFASCGPNQVGCKQYALTGPYTVDGNKVAWDITKGSRYLNKNAGDCDPNSEGCHQFIRVNDNNDTNLVADGSFESSQCMGNNNETLAPKKLNPFVKNALAQNFQGGCEIFTVNNNSLPSPNNRWYIRANSGTVNAGIVNERSDHGSQSLYVEGNGGLYSKDGNQTPTILPTGFNFEDGRYYTLSVMVYVTAGKVRAGFGNTTVGQSAESTVTGSWQNLIITYYRQSGGASDFYVEGTDSSARFYIDSVKVTVGNAQTSYSDYFANNVIYEKLLPKYLEAVCYESIGGSGDAPGITNYQYKANAPSICYNFARKCNAEEVGCVKYTASETDITLTGKVKPKDICPSSCVGYDVFVEQATNFSAASSQYFIPNTARSCNAQAVGCTAFTNLDKLSQGGEAVEYYSYMRSCMKPDTQSCGEFYSWEGSDESGYQLKVYSLKKNGDEPASTMSAAEEAALCSEAIYKKNPNDIGYNPDCREFYGRDGTVSYHLYSHTVSCSDDCHPYRREVASQQDCTAGGGTWDITQSRCIYYAIPGEGTTCSAQEVNCREYTGNIANNTRTVLLSDFENAQLPTDNWGGGAQSNTSLNLGGHSLLGSNFTKTIGSIVRRDESYTISFLAKSQVAGAFVSGIDLINASSETASFGTSGTAVGMEWKLYTFNLAKLNHEVSPSGNGGGDAPDTGEKLRINFSQNVFIDNIKLTEVPNRYYLVKDSWQTPDECDQTITGAYSPRYMLGCAQYTDGNKQQINLHSFSQLCQDSAAGCEQMIDTHNSGDYRKKLYNDTNNNGSCDAGENNCVAVAADSIINVAYDPTKFCGNEDKGCSRYGQAATYAGTTTFTDVYKKDNPDTYGTSLCSESAVGCEAWNANNGVSYFKDPGDQACEYRKKDGTENEYGWFKVKVKRCGGLANGILCSSNSQCGSQQCTFVTTDETCPATSIAKTIGSGGRGNGVIQPAGNWAGLCVAAQSGCTEYIDPISKSNNNLILNPSFETIGGVVGQGWTDGDQRIDTTKAEVNTLYILRGAGALIKSWGDNDVYQLNPQTNEFELVTAANPFKAVPADVGSIANSTEFFIVERSGFSGFTVEGGGPNKVIELRKAIVGYQLKQNVDRSPTTVDFKSGRVLFNERSVAGSTKQRLVYNADQTINDSSKGNPPSSTGQLNANVILKVSPDRTCDKWLACRSYGVDPDNPSKQTCFDIGLCNSMAPNGECQNFVENVPVTNTVLNDGNRGLFANLTGYTQAGYDGNLFKADLYNLAIMKQSGASASLANSSFEEGDDNWTTPDGAVLSKPDKTQDVAYPDTTLPDGTGILQLNQNDTATSDPISLAANTKYIISVYVYNKTGNAEVELLDAATNNLFATLINTSGDQTKNKWLRKVGQVTTGQSLNYKIRLKATGDNTYFDDIRIEAALNSRCDDPYSTNCDDTDKWYVPSSCRLYPKADSLACRYNEPDSNIQQKGWRGYCLQWDPQNENACLLWYPVDKIVSEGAEEGAGVYLPTNLFYCLQTDPECPQASSVQPIGPTFTTTSQPSGFYNIKAYSSVSATGYFFSPNRQPDPPSLSVDTPIYNCSSVVQVDSDRYWRTRWLDDNYKLDGVSNMIHFTPASGGEINVSSAFNASAYFGGFQSFNSSGGIMQYIKKQDIAGNSQGVPYINSNDNWQCKGALFTHEDQGDGCTQYDRATLGKWENCSCYMVQLPTYGCDKCGNCPWGGSGNLCHVEQNPTTYEWTAKDMDAGVSEGDIRYTQSQFTCSSDAKFTYDGTKTTDPKGVLATIFAGSQGAWVRSGNSYSSTAGLIDILSRPICGYPGKCVNNNANCSSDSDCPGSVCFTQRPRFTSSSSFNFNTDYCPIFPKIFNIKVGKYNTSSGSVYVTGGDYIDLKFNTKIDPDQLPLAYYKIDWDGLAANLVPVTMLDNGNLYDRPNANSPHTFKSYLSYSEIFNKPQSEQICGENKNGKCPGKNCCVLKPSLEVRDNWGAYKIIASSQFPVEIVVTDR